MVGENSLPNDDHGIALTFIYTYQGKVFSKPQSIVIAIGVESRWPIYEKERSLSINLGGDVLNLVLERAVQHTNMGYTREDFSGTITYDQFMKITDAKKVSLTIGANRFDLTECRLDALRKLASTIR